MTPQFQGNPPGELHDPGFVSSTDMETHPLAAPVTAGLLHSSKIIFIIYNFNVLPPKFKVVLLFSSHSPKTGLTSNLGRLDVEIVFKENVI